MTGKLITWDQVILHHKRKTTPTKRYVHTFIHITNDVVYTRSFIDANRLHEEVYAYFMSIVNQTKMGQELFNLISHAVTFSSLNLGMQIFCDYFGDSMNFIDVEL